MTDEPRPPVDSPTAMSSTSGDLGPRPDDPPQHAVTGYGPTTFNPVTGQQDEPTMNLDEPDEPTLAQPGHTPDEPTLPEPPVRGSHFAVDGPTVAEPFVAPGVAGPDEPTTVRDDPTTTGPTVGGWPLDLFESAPPDVLVWQPDSAPPAQPAARRNPGYYLALGAAVVLVVGLVAFAALVTVKRPTQTVAGSGSAAIPVVTSSDEPTPTSETTTTTTSDVPGNPYAELAAHPLSTETTRMPDATCALPRFDPADDKQAAFYDAAKVCADAAWQPVLRAAGLDDAQVKLVTVTSPQSTPSCGDLTPTSPPTECEGTVYMTPAYLRDTEQNGRYPGKYFGVFLREYARALQFTAGLDQLAAAVPNGSAADIDTKLDQQATCLAGVAGGSMSGRGAVDANITDEIHQRLTTVDAPPDAQSLLDKGFQQRTPAACNTWTG